jgi:alcohol dehydrogenase class IV
VIVISDPELTVSLPPAITAATGLDAFVHCFEAYCAPGYHPLADGIALEGMRLIQTYLPRACDDGKRYRGALAHAGGGQHGCDRVPEGARWRACDRAPGRGLLQYASWPHQCDRAAVCHRAQPAGHRAAAGGDCPHAGSARRAVPRRVLDWVLAFRQQLRIPHSLAEIGVPLGNAATIGHEASLDPSASGNPLPTDAATYARLFRSAVNGDLTLAG